MIDAAQSTSGTAAMYTQMNGESTVRIMCPPLQLNPEKLPPRGHRSGGGNRILEPFVEYVACGMSRHSSVAALSGSRGAHLSGKPRLAATFAEALSMPAIMSPFQCYLAHAEPPTRGAAFRCRRLRLCVSVTPGQTLLPQWQRLPPHTWSSSIR